MMPAAVSERRREMAHLPGNVGAHVHGCVEGPPAEDVQVGIAISEQMLGLREKTAVRPAPVQQRQHMPIGKSVRHEVPADKLSSADDQDAHWSIVEAASC